MKNDIYEAGFLVKPNFGNLICSLYKEDDRYSPAISNIDMARYTTGVDRLWKIDFLPL